MKPAGNHDLPRFLPLIAAAALLLTACVQEPKDLTKEPSYFPPLGLGGMAADLEARNVRLSANATAAVQADPAVTPVAAAPVVAPSGSIAVAAQAFRDVCVASLPTMAGVKSRLDQVSRRDFGVGTNDIGSQLTVTGKKSDFIYMTVQTKGGSSNANLCSLSMRKTDPSAMIRTLLGTITSAGYQLTPTASKGQLQRWRINGAAPGTIVSVGGKRNFLGQQVTGLSIIWP
ncbi:MAG: hypothetical protein WBC93_04670 [Sulfitobacter sp.]